MDLVFADDARQGHPTRPGMGPLVAVGAVCVPGDGVRALEQALESLCNEFGFPANDEFKWSPGRELWMRDNLIQEDRETFFLAALAKAEAAGVRAVVVVEDTDHRTAQSGQTHEQDAITLLLERVDNHLAARGMGLVITDRPTGDRADEDRFLGHCLETLQQGTRFVRPQRIAINVVSTPSKLVRLLQLADVVTSCTLAYVAGEPRYAPAVFAGIKPLLRADLGRIGGIGLKIHPDFRYANLYHWLLGDSTLIRFPTGVPLPIPTQPYRTSANAP